MSSEFFRAKDKISVRHISGVLRGEGIKRGRISGRFPDVASLRSGSLAVDVELDHLGRLGKGFGLRKALRCRDDLLRVWLALKTRKTHFL